MALAIRNKKNKPLSSSGLSIQKKHSSQAGWSLIEVAIILAIMGVITTGVIVKGFQYMENARLQTTLRQIQNYVYAITYFREHYGQFPGMVLDAKAQLGTEIVDHSGRVAAHFEPTSLSHNEKAWLQLEAVNLIAYPNKVSRDKKIRYPGSGMGGGFSIIRTEVNKIEGIWLVLGEEHNDTTQGGLLTHRQATYLQEACGERSYVIPGEDKGHREGGGRITRSSSHDLEKGRLKDRYVLYILLTPFL